MVPTQQNGLRQNEHNLKGFNWCQSQCLRADLNKVDNEVLGRFLYPYLDAVHLAKNW